MQTTSNKRSSVYTKIAVLAMSLTLIAIACGSDDEGASTTLASDTTFAATTTAAPAIAGGDTADRAAETPAADPLGTGGIAAVNVRQVRDLGRDIIFRADLTVAVTDVAAAGIEASNVIRDLGGFVFGQETVGLPEPRSVLIFKVLPEVFQEALSRLGSIGDVRSQTVSADDVTERIVDIESRIATADASVQRLRGFLEGATDIETIAQLEAQLLDRETTLETLRGSLRTLQDQVALATIVVTLTEALAKPNFTFGLSAYPGHEDAGGSCPGQPDLRVEEGSDVTICFTITNAGDTPLVDLEFTDTVLGLSLDELIVVSGDIEGTLEPGQAIELAAEVTAGRDIRTQSKMSAIPVNAEGAPLPTRVVAKTKTIFVDTVKPEGLPGFGDALSGSLDVLRDLGGVATIMLGVAIPFLWVLLLGWIYLRWRQRRETAMATVTGDLPDSGTAGDPV